MAKEVIVSAVTGLTITIQMYGNGAAIGSPFSTTEIGTTGEYYADMPSNTPYGKYLLVANAGTDKIASGEIFWSGDYELSQAVAMLRGLDPNNPATQTLDNLRSGNIDIAVSGNLRTLTVFTAQP